MKNYRLIIQYDGTRYNGWQTQKTTQNTIQEKIEMVLSKMVGQEVKIHGSGRTDAGVHAERQIANVHLITDKTCLEMRKYLNMYLPDDIRISDVKEVSNRFHSRLNAIKKMYLYRVETEEKSDVFQRKYIYTLGENLNLEKMRVAAQLLCGTHDFQGFSANKSKKKTTIRTLYNLKIEEKGSQILFYFEGNGFLHHMVRIIMGTLIEIGLEKRSVSSIEEIFQTKDRKIAGITAPAEGLCLLNVFYD